MINHTFTLGHIKDQACFETKDSLPLECNKHVYHADIGLS